MYNNTGVEKDNTYNKYIRISIWAILEHVTLVTHVTQGYKIAVCENSSSFLPYMEPVHEKTNNFGFRRGPTQTGLYSHRRWLEAGNFALRK